MDGPLPTILVLILFVLILVYLKYISKKNTSSQTSSRKNNHYNTLKNKRSHNISTVKKSTYYSSNPSKNITLYSRHYVNREWSAEEEIKLISLFSNGLSISELANNLGRSNAEIISQMEVLGLQKKQIPKKTNNYNFYLYHFTDPRNIPSIKKYGLLSWDQLLKRKIIHYPASNDLSRYLDKRYHLENYVRLTLNLNHPMYHASLYYGRVQSLVWLKILPSVIDLPDTLFSNTNATSNNAIINKFKDTALKSNDEQAEILVKERINPSFIIFNQTDSYNDLDSLF